MEVKPVCKQTVCLHFELLYFLKYDGSLNSEYLRLFRLAKLLNEYVLEFMFRKSQKMQNLGHFLNQRALKLL